MSKLEELVKKNLDYRKHNFMEPYMRTKNTAYKTNEITIDKIITDFQQYLDFIETFYDIYMGQTCEVNDIFQRTFGDVVANVTLRNSKYELANVIISLGEIDDIDDIDNKLLEKAVKVIALEKKDELVRRPQLSKCSKLLNYIYEEVYNSENDMLFIENLFQIFSKNDLKLLENEIKKYNLESYISLNDNDCDITVYGDLIMQFNNDKDLMMNEYFEEDPNLYLSNEVEYKSRYLFKDVFGNEFYDNAINGYVIVRDENGSRYCKMDNENFQAEILYLLDENLIENISMYGHNVIREKLLTSKADMLDNYKNSHHNYETFCDINDVLQEDIEYATKNKTYKLYSSEKNYSNQKKMERLSLALFGILTPVDGPYSYVASLKSNKDYFYDNVEKNYIIIDEKGKLSRKECVPFFLLNEIRENDKFIKIDFKELKKLYQDFSKKKEKKFTNYALEKLLEYNNRTEKNMFKNNLELQKNLEQELQSVPKEKYRIIKGNDLQM